MKEDLFYVGIKNPLDVRRSLLESYKHMIKGLQRHERFKEVREEKAEQIIKLKNVMGDIEKLNARLKAELPKTELRAKKEKETEKEGRKLSKHAHSKHPKKVSEIERLEKELDEIENKLSDIS